MTYSSVLMLALIGSVVIQSLGVIGESSSISIIPEKVQALSLAFISPLIIVLEVLGSENIVFVEFFVLDTCFRWFSLYLVIRKGKRENLESKTGMD